ncbi:hypothetical protein Cfor_09800 [Coptotermes formosanus]|uniref:Uncharacterized protein n=1 Tax=Coptotermes formosanus TaxID=36987 RepID=A0A6L2Q9F6_COPFO|nr:hypothetical protein Cfor_09800 [Coptotermes formosanus]
MKESSVHSAKETEWCGVTSSVITQPHIFQEEQLETATANFESYRYIHENFLSAERRCLSMKNLSFKQEDCHIPYT